MISFDKKNLPSCMYKFNIALVTFFAVWFSVVVAVMVTIGCIFGESVITYAVMACGFALFFIGLFIFWLVDNKLHKRLIEQRTAELEKEFCDMPFEEAERILKEKGIITDKGFVVKGDGVFGNEVVPFENEDVWFALNYYQLASTVNLDIVLYEGDRFVGKFELDRIMYNFLANKDTSLKYDNIFNLLINDKKEFVKQALRFTKTLKPDFTSYSR